MSLSVPRRNPDAIEITGRPRIIKLVFDKKYIYEFI